MASWSGFAKAEKLDYWKKEGKAVNVLVKATSITEQNIELKIRGKIQAIGLKQNIQVSGRIIGKVGEIKIVTRPPCNEFERNIHSRWPIILLDNKKFQTFGPEDIIKGQLEI